MNQRIRKLLTVIKALLPKDDIDRLYGTYVLRKEGRRELISIEDNMDESILGIEDDIKKSKET